MIITLCGSIKFMDEMKKAETKLKKLGHKVLMPVKAKGVDYWAEDNKSRVEAKKKFEFIGEHMDKIEKSDAILVVNITKKDIKNYIDGEISDGDWESNPGIETVWYEWFQELGVI